MNYAPTEAQLCRWENFVEGARGNVVELREVDRVLGTASSYYAFLVGGSLRVRNISNRSKILRRLEQIIGVLDFAYTDSASTSPILRNDGKTWIPQVTRIDVKRARPVLNHTSVEELDALVLRVYPEEKELGWNRDIRVYESGGGIEIYVGDGSVHLNYDHPLLDVNVGEPDKRNISKQVIDGVRKSELAY